MKMASKNRDNSLILIGAMLGISFAAHAITIFKMPDTAPIREAKRTVEMEFFKPDPPPEPPKVEPPKPPEPEPPKPKIKIPPPVKLAEVRPPPPKDVPPPPNETPPPETPTKVVPIVVGISMNSTTAAGGFAVQVGNTTYGKADSKVVDPNSVKAYAAVKYAPPGGVDVEPQIEKEFKIPFPEEAKKNDIEGTVRLKLSIDDKGNVMNVVVMNGPGYGLNEAARDALKKFKFKPAIKNGEAIGSILVYAYTFVLD
jgi:periplasmic protein TonB